MSGLARPCCTTHARLRKYMGAKYNVHACPSPHLTSPRPAAPRLAMPHPPRHNAPCHFTSPRTTPLSSHRITSPHIISLRLTSPRLPPTSPSPHPHPHPQSTPNPDPNPTPHPLGRSLHNSCERQGHHQNSTNAMRVYTATASTMELALEHAPFDFVDFHVRDQDTA